MDPHANQKIQYLLTKVESLSLQQEKLQKNIAEIANEIRLLQFETMEKPIDRLSQTASPETVIEPTLAQDVILAQPRQRPPVFSQEKPDPSPRPAENPKPTIFQTSFDNSLEKKSRSAIDFEKFIGENIMTKKITENFNYNLKRIPIQMGLEHGCTIIFLDSDNVAMNDIDFEQLEKVEDGCYGTIFHSPIKVDNNPYYEKLHNFSKNKNIPHFFEHQIMIKISDTQKRKQFIDNWELIYQETKDVQTQSRGLYGSEEGLIIEIGRASCRERV
jgi:hypothetical protein